LVPSGPFAFPVDRAALHDARHFHVPLNPGVRSVKTYRPPSEPHPIREKFSQARKELTSALIERDEEIDLLLTALVANEHVLLVGPPGCGKSLLLDSLLSWTGGSKFNILFTKFTCPEECAPHHS